jgi:hypothetical protein
VFLWTFATNKNYRADFIKNLKRKFSKKAWQHQAFVL